MTDNLKKIKQYVVLIIAILIFSWCGTLPWISDNSESIVWAAETANNSFSTVSDAAAYVRNAMKNRQQTISITLTSTNADYIAISRAVVNEALSHTGNGTEGDYLAYEYGGYSSNIYYIKKVSGYIYFIQYTMSYYTTKQQEALVAETIDQILDSLKLEGKTNYEKVKIIYDYICANVAYDYDNLNDDSYTLKYTAYAALINHSAVCQGYTTLFYRMLLEAGIDCRIITGTANGGAHAWNIVKLGSKYYNVDATWDTAFYDYGMDYVYFLRSDSNFADHTRDSAYRTEAYNNSYPMAEEDYDPENPEPDVSLKDCKIKLSASSYTYNGKAKKPKVTVTYDGQTLKENVDYILSYKNNVNAGTKASVTITGKEGSIYIGSVTKNFTIKKMTNTITASNIKKTISKKKRTISMGVKQKGSGSLTYKSSNKKITVTADGKVVIPAKFVGKATITITAAATTNYKKATKKITVSVSLSGTKFTKLASGGAGRLKLGWKRNALVSGYVIQCSLTSDFNQVAKTKTISGNKTTSTTIKGLKPGKNYYVRIRTYKKYGGKIYYSKWFTY